MKLDREGRRTVAQFLTGLAVALPGTLVFTPMAGGTMHAGAVVGASAGALLCLVLSLAVQRSK